jgi:ADP-ribose pyrophosphatase YjhB (NUDIX family)
MYETFRCRFLLMLHMIQDHDSKNNVTSTWKEGLDDELPVHRFRAFCFTSDGNIYVGKRYSDYRTWSLPGGGVEVGQDMLAALKIELDESLSLKVLKSAVVGVAVVDHPNNPHPARPDRFYEVIFGCVVDDSSEQTADSDTGQLWLRKKLDVSQYPKFNTYGKVGMRAYKKAIEWFLTT